MHGNVCILTESRSLTVFSGRTFRKCGHTFPIWTSGSADPAQKLLPHQHSRSPYTSWKYSAFRGLFDTSFSKNSLKPSSNTSRKSGVTPPTYSWISDNFSVTQQVTCSLKCDLLGHILASEAISAKGEKRKFWLLFSLTNFLFNKAANKPTADHSMAIHRRLDSFSLIFYLLLILWVKTELRQNLPHITFGFQLLRFLSANKHFCWTSRAVKTL